MLGGLDDALLAGYFRGANVDIGNEYLLASIAVIVIGGTSVGGRQGQRPRPLGRGAVPGAAADRAQNLRRQRRRPPGATGLIIVAVITAAGGEKAGR